MIQLDILRTVTPANIGIAVSGRVSVATLKVAQRLCSANRPVAIFTPCSQRKSPEHFIHKPLAAITRSIKIQLAGSSGRNGIAFAAGLNLMAAYDLCRLSRYSKPDFKTEKYEKPGPNHFVRPNLFARPVFVGPDAAIEIDGDAVQAYINGVPSAPGGQLAQLIDRYRERIVGAASTFIDNCAQKIVIAGTWHHIDFSSAPRFEGCLTHIVAKDGSVTTKLYEERVFEWDETPYRAGYGFTTLMYGELAEFADDLNRMADYEVCKTRGRYMGASGLGAVGGMIWSTDDTVRTPVLYSAATCTSEVEFELDEEEEEYLAVQPIHRRRHPGDSDRL